MRQREDEARGHAYARDHLPAPPEGERHAAHPAHEAARRGVDALVERAERQQRVQGQGLVGREKDAHAVVGIGPGARDEPGREAQVGRQRQRPVDGEAERVDENLYIGRLALRYEQAAEGGVRVHAAPGCEGAGQQEVEQHLARAVGRAREGGARQAVRALVGERQAGEHVREVLHIVQARQQQREDGRRRGEAHGESLVHRAARGQFKYGQMFFHSSASS